MEVRASFFGREALPAEGKITMGQTAASGEKRAHAIWARRSETVPFSPAPGIEVRPIIGDSLMTCWISIAPGAVVPTHSHINEQCGVVIGGSVTVTAAGETRTLEVGDAYVVTPNLVHEAVAGPEGVVLVEIFSPVREEYRKLWEEAVRAGST